MCLSLYDELFWVTAKLWGNASNDPKNDLDMFGVNSPHMHTMYTLEAHIFVSFTLRWALFKLQSNFDKLLSVSLYKELFSSYSPVLRKVTWKWPGHVQGQNTNMHSTYTPNAPNFHLFGSMMTVFGLHLNFEKSAPNDPKMTSTWPQKYSYAYPIPEAQIFVSFTLWALLKLQFNFEKSVPKYPKITLTCSIYPYSYYSSNFSVSFYEQAFLSYGPIFKKWTEWPQSDFEHCSMLKFSSYGPFFKRRAPNDPKWPWHVHGSKCPYAYH